jgi:nitrilase
MHNARSEKVNVAVVQAAPLLLDRRSTVAKACRLITEAAGQGADLVLFPEAFIPAYPRGLSFGMVVGSRSPAGRELWREYWAQAVSIPGPATAQLGQAAQEAGVYLAIGVIERDQEYSGGTLYCTLLLFGPDGRILRKHRKLKPTGAERLIWGEGDGRSLQVVETLLGRMGGLICWENYMPLARMALYSQGVEIYLAPTADARDTWQATLRHIALEGRCFVLGSNQYVTKAMLPAGWRDLPEMAAQPEILCRGGSAIIGPLGEVLAGPLYDQEGILYAELDRKDLVRSKLDFDVVGHYARPDVFDFRLRKSGSSADDVHQGL